MSRRAAPKANTAARSAEVYPMSPARPPEGARTGVRSTEVTQ